MLILIFSLLAALAITGALLAREGQRAEDELREDLDSVSALLFQHTLEIADVNEQLAKLCNEISGVLNNSQKSHKLNKESIERLRAQINLKEIPVVCSCCNRSVARYEKKDDGFICVNCIREKELGRNG